MKKINFQKLFKKLATHLIAALAYSLVIFLFNNEILNIVLFLIGAVIGVAFTVLDQEYLYTLYQDKEEGGKEFLVTQSPLYVLALIPTSVFVFTSSGSFLGMGLMGGLILFFLVEMARNLSSPELFFEKFLTSVEVDHTQTNLRNILIGSTIFFVILHFLVLL